MENTAINVVNLIHWNVQYLGQGGEAVRPPSKVVSLTYEPDGQYFKLETKNAVGDTTTSVLPGLLWAFSIVEQRFQFTRTSHNDLADGERALLPDDIALLIVSES